MQPNFDYSLEVRLKTEPLDAMDAHAIVPSSAVAEDALDYLQSSREMTVDFVPLMLKTINAHNPETINV